MKQILEQIGATEPYAPVLRTVMRGWLGYFDEVVIDHLRHRDGQRAILVDLVVSALDTEDLVIDPRIAEFLDERGQQTWRQGPLARRQEHSVLA